MLYTAAAACLGVAALVLAGCATTSHWKRSTAPAPGVDATEPGRSLNAFHNVVKKKVIHAFERLSEGDPSSALSLMHDDVVYAFVGDHALGGTRTDRGAVERWFERLLRLLPSRFRILGVEVSGGPRDTRVYVRFEDTVAPAFGPSYTNQGFQSLHLRWGKVVEVTTFVDTARMIAALDLLHAGGVDEARAPPITR